ncbi:hypothetical protein L227DRAFT_372943 [Lentinus tigrinus ALCF2SS1-6]|uniref:Uncharacterized protein n=1 Tax=Lentinus tigrinus ALCF2SS1-6 TaxID=1328759 RepID=A0A5C2RTU6_9APHY|nr:hypothetical protein L227DRAFT_372943 [Lentinus tigrinus ALCF2SS1-6]
MTPNNDLLPCFVTEDLAALRHQSPCWRPEVLAEPTAHQCRQKVSKHTNMTHSATKARSTQSAVVVKPSGFEQLKILVTVSYRKLDRSMAVRSSGTRLTDTRMQSRRRFPSSTTVLGYIVAFAVIWLHCSHRSAPSRQHDDKRPRDALPALHRGP